MLYYGFLLPMRSIIFSNIVIFGVVIRASIKHGEGFDKRKYYKIYVYKQHSSSNSSSSSSSSRSSSSSSISVKHTMSRLM